MKRAIVIVMDGCGAGEAPDAPQFGDNDQPSTIRHVWESSGGLNAPVLASLGFFTACDVPGFQSGTARFGRLRELSLGGKDSVTGHWEMMGIVTHVPFPTYPKGFPSDLVSGFERAIGTSVLGNKPASGTQIIQELGPEHLKTGRPILYTSADSVFQIACHEAVVPLDRLYEMCRIARALCQGENNVERIIARPFVGDQEHGFERTGARRDFPLSPPKNLADLIGDVYGIGVVPELFDHRGFRQVHRTQNNREHEVALEEALASDARFIFANFEDFDMKFGHRNDPGGFGAAIEEFDRFLGTILPRLSPEDILILTADHGNDPTTPSTDHSREYVPIVLVGGGASAHLRDVDGMSAVGATVADHLSIEWGIGISQLA